MRVWLMAVVVQLIILAFINIIGVVVELVKPFSIAQLARIGSSTKDTSNPVFIYGEITPEKTIRIIKEIRALESDTSVTMIRVDLTSNGGWLEGAQAISQVMEESTKPIEIRCGAAYSAAVYILMSGTPGKRLLYKNAKVVIHEASPYYDSELLDFFGKVYTFGTKRYINWWSVRFLSEKTGQSFARVAKDKHKETWFSAIEAVAYGFADSVIVFEATSIEF